MGRRGPPPKPTVLKLLTGNPGKRKLNRREPKPKSAPRPPSPPSFLGKLAKEEWRRVVPELHRLGLLTKLDRAALAAYCQSWARYIEADKVITDHGMTFMTDKGYVCQRPEVTIAQKERSQMKQFASQFGLTPASRSSINTGEAPPADPDDDFLFNKNKKKSGTGTNG